MLKKVPNTYVIVFIIIVISAFFTWIVPGGEYERHVEMVNGVERTVITPNSFHYTENSPQTWEIFSALFEGFVDKADIIVFILLIGGAFWIMNQSQSIDVGILSFLNFTKKLEKYKWIKAIGIDNIVLSLIMLMFSIFGATFGMSEETIAFIIVLVPLAISMGYDSITGTAIVFVAAGLGFAGAILNPFTIGIAQGLSDLPLFSGIEFRLFSWFVINFIGIAFILRYAHKVKKNPESSLVYEEDEYWRQHKNKDAEKIEYYTPVSAWISFVLVLGVLIVYSVIYPQTSLKIGNNSFEGPVLPILTAVFAVFSLISLHKSVHFFILSLLMITILLLIVGVMGYSWYVMEIASLFFAMGIASGLP